MLVKRENRIAIGLYWYDDEAEALAHGAQDYARRAPDWDTMTPNGKRLFAVEER